VQVNIFGEYMSTEQHNGALTRAETQRILRALAGLGGENLPPKIAGVAKETLDHARKAGRDSAVQVAHRYDGSEINPYTAEITFLAYAEAFAQELARATDNHKPTTGTNGHAAQEQARKIGNGKEAERS